MQKNTTEGSLEEDRKLNAERDAFGIPQQNTTDTLFTLGDLLEAKVSRSGATAHTPLEMEGKQRRYHEDGTRGLITSSAPVYLSNSVF